MTLAVLYFLLNFCHLRRANSKQCRFIVIVAGLFFTLLSVLFYETFILSIAETPARDVDLQYAVVIDAGSSGSRVFIYTWPPHTADLNELLQIRPLMDSSGTPIVKKIEPGLSSVALQPSTASDYLSPLLYFAAKHIPTRVHSETPLYILATAGLRLLNSSQQLSILDDLRSDIPKTFNFSFGSTNVEMITGKQEGVYQWIAINYVLGRFNHNSDGPLIAVDTDSLASPPIVFRKQTLGILDMGGASLQIAFEMTNNIQLKSLNFEQRAHLAEFNLGCTEHGTEHLYHTYVTTYLGFGGNEILVKYSENLTKVAVENNDSSQNTLEIPDPCLPLNMLRTTVTQSKLKNDTITVNILGTGKFDECREALVPLLKNLSGCPGSSCIFSTLPINFDSMEWFGFSEFWYSMEDVLKIGGRYNFYKLSEASKDYCGTEWVVLQNRHQRNVYPQADSNRLWNQCFKLAWITVVLHKGLGLPYDYAYLQSSPSTIAGQVTHWTLGATLHRTRFFPLGAVQREQSIQHTKSGSNWSLYLSHYLFIGCFLLVISAIVLYLRGLNKSCCKKSTHFRPVRYDLEGQIYS